MYINTDMLVTNARLNNLTKTFEGRERDFGLGGGDSRDSSPVCVCVCTVD